MEATIMGLYYELMRVSCQFLFLVGRPLGSVFGPCRPCLRGGKRWPVSEVETSVMKAERLGQSPKPSTLSP